MHDVSLTAATPPTPDDAPRAYPLGDAESELARLIRQGEFFAELTRQFLLAAGLRRGMRVLDIGCGAGDVSLLAAAIVGPEGSVVGVDRSDAAVTLAARRAHAAGYRHVRFVAAELEDFTLDPPADALVGRLVLMYLDNPALTLRDLLLSVKPGGIVAFQEFDLAAAKSEPYCRLYEAALDRVGETFLRCGFDTRLGLRFPRLFREAGLPPPTLSLAARIEHGAEAEVCHALAEITRTLLPHMERLGVAAPHGVEVDTLAERLRVEAAAVDATLIGACARHV